VLLAARAHAARGTGYALLSPAGDGIKGMRLDLRLAHRKLERLSAQDVQILELERGAVCGHTCKVIVLDPPSEGPRPTVESLRDSIAARLDGAPRLRQRLVPTPLGAATPA
jgi:wax ester synthase-like acyl-CoA acyltransferase family protein